MASPRIGIVGVCASGKTTLAGALQARGYDARQISQEHSYVPDLWRRFSKVEVLIYLDASLSTIRARRQNAEWPEYILADETARLAHARQNCHLYVSTDDLTPRQVLDRAVAWLEGEGLHASADP